MMNLTSMLKKDAAIVDLEWLRTGIVHPGEPQLDLSKVKRNNDIKPELAMEWGVGGPDIDLDQPAGIVQRNLPDDAMADAGPVIVFARDMMNRGHRLSKVAAAVKEKFSREAIRKARTGLEEVFRGEGIVGRVAVDGRGYKSCADALKAASNSPYKRFIKVVVGCQCGEPHMMPYDGPGAAQDVVSSGNPTDDFLASDKAAAPRMAAHCRSTMLRTVASVGDLDPSEMDQTLVEVMNVTGLPSGIKDEIAASGKSVVGKLRAAFKWLDRQADKAEAGKYAGRVSAREDRVAQAPMDFDIAESPFMEDIDVVEEVGPISEEILGDLAGAVPQDIDVVEMGQPVEPEFMDTDVVPLDEVPEADGVLDVEMLAQPDDEMEFLAGDRKG